MDSLFSWIPGWLWVLLGLGLLALLATVALSLLIFLFKVGVAINEARKPPHFDTGDYRIDQGREIRPELAQRRDTGNAERSE